MPFAIDVVKHGKRSNEPFDQDKLYRSVYMTCLSIRIHEGAAHDTANHVIDRITLWLSDKSEVTTTDLRHQIAKHMATIHPEAAHFYKHHKQIM